VATESTQSAADASYVAAPFQISFRPADNQKEGNWLSLDSLMNQMQPKPETLCQGNDALENITLDGDHVLSYTGGDTGQLILLCANLLLELPIFMERLTVNIRQREHISAAGNAQRLGTSLLVFGSEAITGTLAALETSLRCGRRRQALIEWRRLQRQLDSLVPQVQRLMLEVASPRCRIQ
jgi:hypothetical protein